MYFIELEVNCSFLIGFMAGDRIPSIRVRNLYAALFRSRIARELGGRASQVTLLQNHLRWSGDSTPGVPAPDPIPASSDCWQL